MGQSSVALTESSAGGDPEGQPYDWYHRALALLDGGNADAAAQLLEHLLAVEPTSLCALEAYARALFDARRYGSAAKAFAQILDRAPDDDYAHFGLGMSLWHVQEFVKARDELAMAFVMRPTRSEYSRALAQVKATLRSRVAGNLPLNGPVPATFPAASDSSRPIDSSSP